jgi:hypothetical protein
MNTQSPPTRFMIWVDAVGGFLVCVGDEVTIGQAVVDAHVDVPLVADIARRHATIRRDPEGYVVDPHGETRLDDRVLKSPAPLADAAALRFGPVGMRFRRPHPLSATARLELTSSHRLRPSCDGVLLLAQSCVLGAKSTSHIVCPDWESEVMLFYSSGKLTCHVSGEFEIDGRSHTDCGPLGRGSRVTGDSFSFSLEPV